MKNDSSRKRKKSGGCPAYDFDDRGWVLPNVGIRKAKELEKIMNSASFDRNLEYYSDINKIISDIKINKNVF